MKILIVSPKNKTVFNFRGDLIKDMIARGNEVIVTGPNRDYLDDIYALGVSEFVEVPFTKDKARIKGDFDYYRRLKKVIREKKPDLVFSYTIKPVVYGSLAAKAVTRFSSKLSTTSRQSLEQRAASSTISLS